MNTDDIKKDFTILQNKSGLRYLDSAATSLTPESVIAKMDGYYRTYNANIARGVYDLSEKATEEYESVRTIMADFIGSNNAQEIVFTSGTTASINMLAFGLLYTLTDTSRIAVTAMDHHANFVPWQRNVTSENFDVVAITPAGLLDLDSLREKVTSQTAVLALPYVSNVLGTINPIAEIVTIAKTINPEILVVVDAAQAAPHMRINVTDLGCDALVFSGHKLLGPTGTGVLWAKMKVLEQLTPLFTGGEMIEQVTFSGTTFRGLPHRLESGTPNIAGVIGLGAAVNYIQHIGIDEVRMHEKDLVSYAYDKLQQALGEDVSLYGPVDTDLRSGVLSFSIAGIHPHDLAALLDADHGICIRAGQHCAMPLHMETLGVSATARASFYIYNTREDVDALIAGIISVREKLT